MSQQVTKDTPQYIKNRSFDSDFDTSKVELVGYDSSAGVLRPIAVDTNGQVKTTGVVGSSLTVKEEDGSPTGTPDTLKFPNGSITDNGDGSFSVAAGGSYTDEQAQDAVGGILNNTGNVQFTYDDATPKITAAVDLSGKVDVVAGKGLSTNDYDDAAETKLAGIEAGAEVNNISDVNATDLTDSGATTLHKHSYNNLDDKPTLGTAAAQDTTAFDAAGVATTAVSNHAALLTGVHGLAITAGKTITVEDNSLINQDLTSDASPTFGGLTVFGGTAGTTDEILARVSVNGGQVGDASGVLFEGNSGRDLGKIVSTTEGSYLSNMKFYTASASDTLTLALTLASTQDATFAASVTATHIHLTDTSAVVYGGGGTYIGSTGASTDLYLVARNASRVRLDNTTLYSITDAQISLGKAGNAFNNGVFSGTLSASNLSGTNTGDEVKATAAEINTGTDTSKVVTPDALAGSNLGTRYLVFSLCGSNTLNTTDGVGYQRIPAAFNGMNLVSVKGEVGTGTSGASSSGTPTFTVKNVTDNNQMCSTNLTIDANEYTSATAATAVVIDTTKDDVATDDLIEVACTVAGTAVTYATVTLGFQLP